MEILKKICLIILFLGFSFLQITAQNTNYSINNKKAIKLFEEANEHYKNRQPQNAIPLLLEAIEKDSTFVEAHTLLGYVYIDSREKENALKSFKKALRINPSFSSLNLFFAAQLSMELGDYQSAKIDFERYLLLPKADPRLRSDAQDRLVNVEYALEAMKNPVPFKAINIGDGVNSAYSEYFPSITVDGSTLLYTRQLPAPDSPIKFNEDFYVSKLVNGQWEKSENLGVPINTENNEGAPTLSADGKLLIFTACEFYGEYGAGRQGYGSCDLFYSQRIGDRWLKAENLGKPVNTNSWETQPSFSADGKTLYFIRRVKPKSGKPHSDIFVTELNAEGYWSVPKALPMNINTDKNEESVFIHPDGQTLYFSSDGHPGMGDLDIYVSRKDKDGKWGNPKNLGYPINTFGNENSILISPDGQKAYFASDREGGFGGLDLYEFALDPSIQPKQVSYLAGKVIDAETKKPLSGKFELINMETEETVIASYSDPNDGSFLIALPLSRDYALNVSKDGYLFYSENFTIENSSVNEPYKKNIELHKIKVGEKVILKNIFYATNEYELLGNSKAELNKLVAFLKKNEKIAIEIAGHTDNEGSIELNNTLSTNRAKEVYNYLIANGINSARLSYKGYGQSQPIASNSTAKGKAQNRRTEFKVLAID